MSFFPNFSKKFSQFPPLLFSFLILGVVFSSSAAIIVSNKHLSSQLATSQQASIPKNFKLAQVSPATKTGMNSNIVKTGEKSAPEEKSIAKPTVVSEVLIQPDSQPKGRVLGTNSSLDFRAKNGYSMNDGVIVFSSAAEPTLDVAAYNYSQEVEFTLYKIGQQDLLNYLLYSLKEDDDKYLDMRKLYQFDTDQLEQVTTFKQYISGDNNNNKTHLNLSLDKTGLWYLEGKAADKKIGTVIVRSDIAGVANKSDNKITFWVQDANKKLVSDAKITVLNTEDSLTNLAEVQTDAKGLAQISAQQGADVAIVTRGDSITMIPVNLTGFMGRYAGGSFYSSFAPRQVSKKSFAFTDRLVYKPSDKIYFKAVVRDEDDAHYTIPSGQVRVTLSKGGDNKPYEAELLLDDLGTVDGEIQLAADVDPGYYTLTVYDGDRYLSGTSLQVAEFHKPDSEVTLSLDEHTYFPGDTLQARISGKYFLGQPLAGQEVKYKIYQNSSYLTGSYEDIDFNTGVYSFSGSNDGLILEGSVTLDSNGQAPLNPKIVNTSGYRQFWKIVLEYVDPTGAATNDGAQVLVNPGDFVLEGNRKAEAPNSYVKNQPASIKLSAVPTQPGVSLSGIKVSAKLYDQDHSDDQTDAKTIETQQLTTDENGNFEFNFTPSASQSYYLELEAHDQHQHLIKGKINFYVQQEQSVNNTSKNETISIISDKSKYNPGETAHIKIEPSFEAKDMFVYWGRTYSKDYRVLENGTREFSFLIPEDYQPNFHLNVGSFVNDSWVVKSQDIQVNTADKKVNVEFSFDQDTYGPAQTAVVDITAKDDLGNPVQTDLAVWVFDKALLELNKESYGNIFNNFWKNRYDSPLLRNSFQGLVGSGAEGGGGCFAADTPILMADGSQKAISQIEVGDEIQTLKAENNSERTTTQVTATHRVTVDGYLIINQDFKITPEHILLVNGIWKTAGEIRIGDKLITSTGEKQSVNSIEWVRGKFDVYNLTTAKYHTFIAHDIYVHNDKGDSRTIFKDTAYWNPHVTTDANGQARISIKLPDNLTTWVMAGVAANEKTQVGSGEDEFIVTKEVVVRPVTPSFLRQGDSLFLSALINNFTAQNLDFNVTADFDIAALEEPNREIKVAANDVSETAWATRVDTQEKEATYKVKAETKDNKYTDEVTLKIPVFEYGFWQDRYILGMNQQSIELPMTTGSDPARSSATLFLQASRYPEFKLAWENIMLDQNEYFSDVNAPSKMTMVAVGELYGDQLQLSSNSVQNQEIMTASLKSLQNTVLNDNYDWFNYKDITPKERLELLSALIFSQKAGYRIDQKIMNRVVRYFSDWQPSQYSDQVLRQYALSLLPAANPQPQKLALQKQSDAQIYLMAILANYYNGFETDKQQVIQQILDIKTENEHQLSWSRGVNYEWGGALDASLLANHALIELGADQQLVEKSLDYLYRNRGQQASYQLIKNLAEYKAKYTQPAAQNSYEVVLNGKKLKTGSLAASDGKIAEVTLSVMADGTDQLQINYQGKAPLYTKVKMREFMTDKEKESEKHAFEITREYLAADDEDKPVEVGDLVVVEFTVKNLGAGEKDLEIIDYLPSGLLAVDQSLDNGVFDKVGTEPIGHQKISGQTVELKINSTAADTAVFRYKARVVSQGTFDTPPAIIRHSAAPELWARSDSTRLVIDGKNKLKMLKTDDQAPEINTTPQIPWGLVALAGGIGLSFIGYGLWLHKEDLLARFAKKAQHDETPPLE